MSQLDDNPYNPRTVHRYATEISKPKVGTLAAASFMLAGSPVVAVVLASLMSIRKYSDVAFVVYLFGASLTAGGIAWIVAGALFAMGRNQTGILVAIFRVVVCILLCGLTIGYLS